MTTLFACWTHNTHLSSPWEPSCKPSSQIINNQTYLNNVTSLSSEYERQNQEKEVELLVILSSSEQLDILQVKIK